MFLPHSLQVLGLYTYLFIDIDLSITYSKILNYLRYLLYHCNMLYTIWLPYFTSSHVSIGLWFSFLSVFLYFLFLSSFLVSFLLFLLLFYLYFLLFFFILWDRLTLCILNWPWTHCEPRLASNLQESAYIRILNAEITHMYHHSQLFIVNFQHV